MRCNYFQVLYHPLVEIQLEQHVLATVEYMLQQKVVHGCKYRLKTVGCIIFTTPNRLPAVASLNVHESKLFFFANVLLK